MKLDNLPNENLIAIFGYLDLYDLIQKRLVNKRWRAIITHEMAYKELNIIDYFSTSKSRWYYTGKPLNFQFLLAHYENDPLPTTIYRSKLFSAMFGKLKYLRLSCVLSEAAGFHLEVLNDFQSLYHLDIFSLLVRSKKTLSLANLRVLSINKFYIDSSDKSIVLTVCAKNLKHLHYGFNLDTVQFVYPSSVTFINTHYNRNIKNLSVFVNLQVLICSNVRFSDFDDEISFDDLPRLKEVHLFQTKFNSYELNSSTYQRYKRYFNKLRNREASSKRRLVISFQGIKLTSDDQFERCNFSSNSIGLQLENYDALIDRLPWFKRVDYKEVLRVSNGHLPSDFFSRFGNVQYVLGHGLISDEISFLLFLTKCPNLRSLALFFVQISESFYAHLPKIYHLNSLRIQAVMNDLIDYSFVPQLRYLNSLDTNQTLSFRFVVRAFEKSAYYLESISFRTRDERYLIDKTGPNRYYLECFENTKEKDLIFLKKNMNLRKLAELCRDLEDRNLIVSRPNKRQKTE